MLAELERWAVRGNQDAEIALAGLVRSADRSTGQKAYQALQKVWSGVPSPSASSTIAEATRLQRQGQLQQAMELWNQLVEDLPSWSGAYHLRAKCWNQMKDTDKTLGDLRKALELRPINYAIMVELGLVLMNQAEYAEALALFQRAGSLCPFLPMLDAIMRQVLQRAPELEAGAAEAVPEAAALTQAPPEGLLPEAWAGTSVALAKGQPATELLRFGVELEAWLAQLQEVGCPRKVKQQLLAALTDAWEPEACPATLRPLALHVHAFLQPWLAVLGPAPAVSAASAASPLAPEAHSEPALAVPKPELLNELATNFAAEGWAQVKRLGIAPSLLSEVYRELARIDTELEPGTTSGGLTPYRNDRILWLGEGQSSELARHDLPALGKLHLALQDFVDGFVRELENGPLRLSLRGRCRPMLARYDPGGYYWPHIDNSNRDGRVLTVIYYLNPQWDESKGGQLRLYPGAKETDHFLPAQNVEIWPEEDNLVLFRADELLHEVRPACARRFALTQWHFGEYLAAH